MTITITQSTAVANLRAEGATIATKLSAAQAALAAAQTAAAEVPPTVASIGPGELETARLSDLAGLTTGKLAALQSQKTTEAAAYAAWQSRVAQAKTDIQTHSAAVAFQQQAALNAEDLLLTAEAGAVASLLTQAETDYRTAVQALRSAAEMLVGLRAIQQAPGRRAEYRRRGAGWDGLLPWEPEGVPLVVPSLAAVDANLNAPTAGKWTPAAVEPKVNGMSAVDTIRNALKGA